MGKETQKMTMVDAMPVLGSYLFGLVVFAMLLARDTSDWAVSQPVRFTVNGRDHWHATSPTGVIAVCLFGVFGAVWLMIWQKYKGEPPKWTCDAFVAATQAAIYLGIASAIGHQDLYELVGFAVAILLANLFLANSDGSVAAIGAAVVAQIFPFLMGAINALVTEVRSVHGREGSKEYMAAAWIGVIWAGALVPLWQCWLLLAGTQGGTSAGYKSGEDASSDGTGLQPAQARRAFLYVGGVAATGLATWLGVVMGVDSDWRGYSDIHWIISGSRYSSYTMPAYAILATAWALVAGSAFLAALFTTDQGGVSNHVLMNGWAVSLALAKCAVVLVAASFSGITSLTELVALTGLSGAAELCRGMPKARQGREGWMAHLSHAGLLVACLAPWAMITAKLTVADKPGADIVVYSLFAMHGVSAVIEIGVPIWHTIPPEKAFGARICTAIAGLAVGSFAGWEQLRRY